MVVIDHPISWEQLMNIEEEVFFEDMMKCVADIERGLLAVNADLHSDLEELLLLDGSKQEHLYGFNLLYDD